MAGAHRPELVVKGLLLACNQSCEDFAHDHDMVSGKHCCYHLGMVVAVVAALAGKDKDTVVPLRCVMTSSSESVRRRRYFVSTS